MPGINKAFKSHSIQQPNNHSKVKVKKNAKNSLFAKRLQQQTEISPESFEKKVKEDGTDLAVKKIAAEFEISFESFMQNLQHKPSEDSFVSGGIGGAIYHGPLVDAMIKKMREGNPGPIAKAIEEQIRHDESRNKNESSITRYNRKH